jgi:hypothetical protein
MSVDGDGVDDDRGAGENGMRIIGRQVQVEVFD